MTLVPFNTVDEIADPSKENVTIGEFMNDTQHLDEEAHPKNQHQPAVMLFNTSKHNKNLISFTGVLILSFIFIIQTILPLGSRLGWITQKNAGLYLYVHLFSS